MNKKGLKVLASMLIFILTFSYFSVIGEAIAASTMSVSTGNANVEFDAYLKENDVKTYAALQAIGEENYFYAKVTVKNEGYLKTGTISFTDPNFEIAGDIVSDYVSKVENNVIYLNQINSGNSIELAIPIKAKEGELVTKEDFYKQVPARFDGTYINGEGKSKTVSNEITVGLKWFVENLKDYVELDHDITRVIQYTGSDSLRYIAIQWKINTKIRDNVLPVINENIEISLPQINAENAILASVSANTTKQINGEVLPTSFNETNYTFDNAENKVTIEVENTEDSNGKISWKKDANDEYIVTAVYKAGAVDVTSTSIPVNYTTQVSYTAANDGHANKSLSVEGERIQQNYAGNLVEFSAETNLETISKGQIYANVDADNKVETSYEEKIEANVTFADLINKIIIEQNADDFVNEDGTTKTSTTVSGTNNSYFKTVTINKENFEQILGTDGEILIYNGTTLIAAIDKHVDADAKGNYVVNIADTNVNAIRMETSKPVAPGKLQIGIQKAIKGDVTYTVNQLKEFKNLEMNVVATSENNAGLTNASETLTKTIALTEPETVAELTIDSNRLSTIVTNKDVKLTTVLRTDSLACKLFKEPTLKITLPSYIQEVNIKNVEVLFGTDGSNLYISNYQVIDNPDGTKTIEVVLSGTQTEYMIGAVSKGVNVVVTADLTANKLTPNRTENVVLTYTNNNVETEEKTATASMQFIAPTGIVTISQVSNYADGAEPVTAISEEEMTATIPTMKDAKEATFNMYLINNYNNNIDNVSILGRTLSKDNKEPVTGVNMGSTIDMPLTTGISVGIINPSNATVYYSENANATKDLSNSANGWTTSPADFTKVKSYLIVVNNPIGVGEGLSFTYNASIPANLDYNEYSYGEFVAYFNNNLATGTIEDKATSTKFGLTTGRGPILEASLSSDTEEAVELQKDDIITYKLTVKNTGTETATNVITTINLPNGLSYVEENTENPENGEKYITASSNIEIGNLAAGETFTKDLLMKVTSGTQDVEVVEATATVKADNISAEVKSNSVKNTVLKTYFSTTGYVQVEEQVQGEGQEFTYSIISLARGFGSEVNNSTLELTIPDEFEYQNTNVQTYSQGSLVDITNDVSVNYNIFNKKLTVNLGKLTANNQKITNIKLKVKELPNDVYDKVVTLEPTISGDGARTQRVNESEVEIGKLGFKVSQTSSITEGATITACEDFKYIVTIENLSNIAASNVKVKDILPEELVYSNAIITRESGFTTSKYDLNDDGYPEVTITLKPKEKVTVEFNVIADTLSAAKKISNKIIVSANGIADTYSNTINHTIAEYEIPIADDEGGSSSEAQQYKRIMGTIWEDKNGNGSREEDETKLSGVKVMLFNNATGDLVRTSNGTAIETTTDENGVYTFSNIRRGRYTVIFLYDTANYSATFYHMDGVSEVTNSDGVDTFVTLDGENKQAAITEEVKVSDSNVYNIDLGLVVSPKFDLKLDKTVSKITLQDSTGTKTSEYINSKLAKQDLVGSRVNETTIAVEYKLTVTNEGAIPGYVKKIVDYMPQDMRFSSEVNKDWYTGANGELYNSSLANIEIKPGETKEVTLILTKKMTENNLGLINNTAEIYEAYNDLGMPDVDSTVANKATSEDDLSSADVLVTVKTGEALLFIGIAVIAVAVITGGAIIIKKKVLR